MYNIQYKMASNHMGDSKFFSRILTFPKQSEKENNHDQNQRRNQIHCFSYQSNTNNFVFISVPVDFRVV